MNAASLRRFRWWIPVFVMLTPVLCSAQTADFPSCYYSYQGNGDEDAVVEFSVPAEGVIETATVRYRAGTGHCTSVKVHIYVDDVFVATTAYLPAGEYSQAFDVTYLLGGASGAVVTLEFDSCEAGVGCCEGPPYGSWAGWTCLEGTVAGNGCPELLGPTPYLWFEDSPFAGLDFGAFYFEDFEDHVMSLTNITLDDQNGMVSSDHPAGPSSIDSVDGDDGDPNDGGCSDCDAWWALGPYGVHVLFQEDDQGRLPTHAGVVWTDGEGLVSFNAYGNDSSLLGTIGPVAIADGSFNGTTAEDRFFGVICTDGISRVHISNAGGGMEIDHIQFGYSGTGGLSWTDVTSGQPLNDPRYTVGAAWGDYDGDGYHDLYLATTWAGTPDGENRLLRNNAGSGFTDVTDALLGNPDQTHGAVWGDYDNDGRLDLYLTNHDAANVLLRNEGAGSFTDVTTGPLGNTFDGSTATWADYDLDSLVDIYIGNNVDHERLLHNEGDGVFVDATVPELMNMGFVKNHVWIDYDNDFDQDLCIGIVSGPNKFIRNDGDGDFSHMVIPELYDEANTIGYAWGDYDNDGDLDVVACNNGSTSKLLRNDGQDVFVNVTATSGALDSEDTANTAAAWADYDNDGDLDLAVAGSGYLRLLNHDGSGAFTDVTSPVMTMSEHITSLSWADYDNDGDLDLYVAVSPGENRLFRNENQLGTHWLHLDLEGSLANRSAIGARVRIVADGVPQIREISAGNGSRNQNSLTVEFGLGAAVVADTVQVFWPISLNRNTPHVTYLYDVPADQRIMVTESITSVEDTTDRIPEQVVLRDAFPNPFNPRTTIRYELTVPTHVRLRLYDLTGRLVDVLVGGVTQPAGTHSIVWTGCDAQGRAMSSGTYFCRLEAGPYTQTIRMTLVR